MRSVSDREAHDQLTCKLERLRALYASNNAAFGELCNGPTSGDQWRDRREYEIWMIFTLAGEKLDEIEALVAKLDYSDCAAATPACRRMAA